MQDKAYLDNLLGEEQRSEEQVTKVHISQAEYINGQIEDTDLYRFMKHCLPERYLKFKHDIVASQSTNKTSSSSVMYNTPRKDNFYLRAVKKISKAFLQRGSGGGRFTKIFSVLPQTKDDERLIEVFDVLIKTQNRLIIRDTKS